MTDPTEPRAETRTEPRPGDRPAAGPDAARPSQASQPSPAPKQSRSEKRQAKRAAKREAKLARKQRSAAGAPVTGAQSPQQASAQNVGSAIGRSWWIVLLLAVLGGGIAAGAVYALPQRTIGTTTVLVDIPVEATDTEALVRTVETLILSQAVLSDVAQQPGVDLSPAALEDAMQVERATGSAVIEVSAVDTSEERVRAIVDAVIPSLQERLGDVDAAVTPDPGEDPAAQPGGGSVPLAVTTFGTEPYVRDYSLSLVPTVALGALGGALLGGLVVVVRALRRLPA